MRYGIDIPEKPKTIQEKLIWLQFYDEANYLKPMCADKLRVREYAIEKIGKDICVPLLKVYNRPEDFNIDELPTKFAIKSNHSNNQVILCRDKGRLNKNDTISIMKGWLSKPFGIATCEPHYLYIERKCFAEELLGTPGQLDVVDYKFMCFNGQPKLMQLIQDRHGPEKRLQYYDMDKRFVNVHQTDFKCRPELKHKDVFPVNFDKMKEYAEKLSAPFKFVRVDFYEVDNVVYLGEMTFVPAAAKLSYKDPKTSIMLGDMIKL